MDPCIVLQEGSNQKSNRKRDSTPTVPAPQHSSINVTASWRLMATTRPGRTRRQQALFSVLDSIVWKIMKKLSRPGMPRLRHLVRVNHVVECSFSDLNHQWLALPCSHLLPLTCPRRVHLTRGPCADVQLWTILSPSSYAYIWVRAEYFCISSPEPSCSVRPSDDCPTV